MSVQDRTVQAVLALTLASPGDGACQDILHNALLDAGLPEPVADEAYLHRRLSVWDVDVCIGSGSGSPTNEPGPYQVRVMRIGHAYLVHCGDWHTYVGRVVEQLGPCTYEMECVSKVTETHNGDCWHDLAAGENFQLRLSAEYKHYRTRCVIPLTIAAFEWHGRLPQEKL